MMATTGALSPHRADKIQLSKLESDGENDENDLEKKEKNVDQEVVEVTSAGNEAQ